MGVSVKKVAVTGDAAAPSFAPAPLSVTVSAPAMSGAAAFPSLLDQPRPIGFPAPMVVGTLGDMAPPPAVGFDGFGKKRKR